MQAIFEGAAEVRATALATVGDERIVVAGLDLSGARDLERLRDHGASYPDDPALADVWVGWRFLLPSDDYRGPGYARVDVSYPKLDATIAAVFVLPRHEEELEALVATSGALGFVSAALDVAQGDTATLPVVVSVTQTRQDVANALAAWQAHASVDER